MSDLPKAKGAFKNAILHDIGLSQFPAKRGGTGITCRNDMNKARAGMINKKLTAQIPAAVTTCTALQMEDGDGSGSGEPWARAATIPGGICIGISQGPPD